MNTVEVVKEKSESVNELQISHKGVGSEVYHDIKRFAKFSLKWLLRLVVGLVFIGFVWSEYSDIQNKKRAIEYAKKSAQESRLEKMRLQEKEAKRQANMLKITGPRETKWRKVVPHAGYSGYSDFIFTSDNKFYFNIDSTDLTQSQRAQLISERHHCNLEVSTTEYSKKLASSYSLFDSGNATVSSSFFLSFQVEDNSKNLFEQFNLLELDCGWFGYSVMYGQPT